MSFEVNYRNHACMYLVQVIVGDGKNNDDYVYVENVAYGHICAEKALSTEEGAMTTGGQV